MYWVWGSCAEVRIDPAGVCYLSVSRLVELDELVNLVQREGDSLPSTFRDRGSKDLCRWVETCLEIFFFSFK